MVAEGVAGEAVPTSHPRPSEGVVEVVVRAVFALLRAPRDYTHARRWTRLGFQGSPWLTCVKTFV